jgi:hypothetical protein
MHSLKLRRFLFGIAGAVAGYAYGKILALIGLIFLGAGHGTPIFYLIAAGPWGVGLYFWCVAGLLVYESRCNAVARQILKAVLVLFYVWAIGVLLFGIDDVSAWSRVIRSSLSLFMLYACLLVGGQAFLLTQLSLNPLPVKPNPDQ